MKFRTNWNSEEFPDYSEHPTGVSMTIPDQTMSVSDMLKRHSKGLAIPDGKVPIYNYDVETGEAYDLPDLLKMDLAEKQQLLEDAKEHVQKLRDDLNRNEQQQRQLQAERIKKEREELLEQLKPKTTPKQSRSVQPGASHPGAMEGFTPDSGA